MLNDSGGKGHAANVVLHFMSEKLNNGNSIYMDNFYNSVNLIQQLLQKNTYIPEAINQSKLKSGQSKVMYSKGVMIGKWKDK